MRQYSDYQRKDSNTVVDFHGATVINEHGEEIPITEQMVQHACRKLIQQWEQFHQHNQEISQQESN